MPISNFDNSAQSMVFEGLISWLDTELTKPLPGRRGQIKMAPEPINDTRFNFNHHQDAKAGGVMILLYPMDGRVYFPLMERNKYPGAHSGQISLPGGKMEAEDADLVATALRETHEELGVPAEDIQVLGSLTDIYVEVSNFRVSPTVAYAQEKPNFMEDRREVLSLLHADLNAWMQPAAVQQREMRVRDDLELRIPYFEVDGRMVWGATSMIMSEFITILNRKYN